MTGVQTVLFRSDSNLLMEDGVITYIGPEEQQAEEVIDAAGCIVYPGLINTHHHLYQTFSRKDVYKRQHKHSMPGQKKSGPGIFATRL